MVGGGLVDGWAVWLGRGMGVCGCMSGRGAHDDRGTLLVKLTLMHTHSDAQ